MIEKQQEALATVKRYMWYSAGAGLIPIPYLDGAAISGLQLKMLADVSRIYGVPFQENLGKAALASLACFIIPHAAAFGALSKAIPGLSVLGAPLAVVFAWAYTWALGNIFIQHFESGGTFLNFNPEQVREHFRAQFEGGQKVAPAVQG
jgi:uncharacterized protein (DUF697 family)